MSLSAEEFWHICNSIAGPRTTIDKATLYSAICCAGKSVIRSHLNNLWPTDKDEVDLEHAFRIFDRLEDLVVDQSDLAKIRRDGIEVEVEQLLEQLPTERREKVKQSLEPFTHNGKLNLEEFISAVELTKHETLTYLLQLQQNPAPALDGAPSTSLGQKVIVKPKQSEGKDSSSKLSFGGVLFTRPLRVVKHVLEGHGPCRVALKIVRNGDMRPDAFDNDVFGVVTDNSGRVVAVTTQLYRDSYRTEEFQLEHGFTFTVMGLGTTIQNPSKDKQRVDLTANGKLSKRFKMSLLNVFDMFDFDGDGLLSRSEYAAFAVATADTPPDDEEWDLLTSQFDARAGGITMAGFLFMHECEAFSGDDLAIPDIWESLYRLGYDNNLQLHYTCPFSISIECDGEVSSTPRLSMLTRSDRDQILRGLYYRGRVDERSHLFAHIFATDYFGMMIVHNKKEGDKKTYRMEIDKEEDVKWNFFHGRDDIDPTASGDWMLVCAYRSTGDHPVAEFHLVEEATTVKSLSSA